MNKICRYCGEGGFDKEFKVNKCSSGGIDNVHKRCHARYTYTKILEKKLKLYPKLYAQCDNDDCMHIFRRRRIKDGCPKCNGKEIIYE